MKTDYEIYDNDSDGFKDESLDRFIGQRGRILNSKLEVLMQEIWARLAIRNQNIGRLNDDLDKAREAMDALSPRAHYFGDTPEKDAFHRLRESRFELERERREQDVSCWNDVVRVMEELMNTWEAHQQTSARAELMKSGGLEKLLEETYTNKKEAVSPVDARFEPEGHLP
jgi:hypothetical protein